MIPLAQFGEPKDIANIVVFLASDDSNYITGQTFMLMAVWSCKNLD